MFWCHLPHVLTWEVGCSYVFNCALVQFYTLVFLSGLEWLPSNSVCEEYTIFTYFIEVHSLSFFLIFSRTLSVGAMIWENFERGLNNYILLDEQEHFWARPECYSLDLECLSNTNALKNWSPVHQYIEVIVNELLTE